MKTLCFLTPKAACDLGSARYYGSSIATSCQELKKAIELFATFKPETAYHPSGSVAHALEVAEACKE